MPGSDAEQITTLLLGCRAGDKTASDRLVAVLYSDLHRMAAAYLRRERRDHTLAPTELVNELYLRLFGSESVAWQDKTHFMAAAAQTLRRILVDHARSRMAEKRGGGQVRISLTAIEGWSAEHADEEILALNEALETLMNLEPRAGKVVELRFFGGLSEDEVAEVLRVSAITVKRDWKFARAWLTAQLLPGSGNSGDQPA